MDSPAAVGPARSRQADAGFAWRLIAKYQPKRKPAGMNCTPKVGHQLLGCFFMYRYSEQFRLTVIQSYLDGQAGYGEIAKRHEID
ncbi:hypothetical protein AB4120_23805, partial [Cupriavidus sp. 2KB_3]|uniref:hypothetical protein n=1 Tax=Cupriavidus sp. 2KB_3 TaxID=3232980 RepID=UPI003F934130